jgi:hypothetical protein
VLKLQSYYNDWLLVGELIYGKFVVFNATYIVVVSFIGGVPGKTTALS